MSLNPLSWELQRTGYGYQLDEQTKINHLFYVDDLKLYGTSDKQLTALINTVKNVLGDIKIEFGLDKCAKASLKRGKKVSENPTEWQASETRPGPSWNIQVPGNGRGRRGPTPQMKVKIKKEYKRRINLVLKFRTECKAQDSKHQYASSPSNPLQLWSHWLETGWDTGPWQDDQEATVYELDASQEGKCKQDIPPMPRRGKITHESGKGIQCHNDRTTDIHDKQGWCPDTSCPQTPELQGFSLCTQGSREIHGRGWNNRWHDSMILARQPLGRPNSWSSSTRKTSWRWWGINGKKRPCMESSPPIWTRIMSM